MNTKQNRQAGNLAAVEGTRAALSSIVNISTFTTGTQQVILGPAVSTTAGPSQVFEPPTATTATQFQEPTATPIHTAGRRCGAVKGDCWHKTIHGDKHILRYPKPSIAFSVESVGQAKSAGAVRVDVFDDIGGVHYCATLARIEQFGFEVHRAGFERQVALPLVFFIRQGADVDGQLRLFGGAR